MKIKAYFLSTLAFLVCAMSLSFSAYANDSGSSLWSSSDRSIYSTFDAPSQAASVITSVATFHYHPTTDEVSSHAPLASLDKNIHKLSDSGSCFLPSVEQPVDKYAVFYLKLPELSAFALARLAKPSMHHLSLLRFPKFTSRSYQRQSNYDVARA